jgi:hypothetical protein
MRHPCAIRAHDQPVSTGGNRIGFGLLMGDPQKRCQPPQIREIPILERMGYA